MSGLNCCFSEISITWALITYSSSVSVWASALTAHPAPSSMPGQGHTYWVRPFITNLLLPRCGPFPSQRAFATFALLSYS